MEASPMYSGAPPWTLIVLASIYAIPSLLSWWQSRQAAISSATSAEKSDQVHDLINSRMTELVKAEVAKAMEQGKALGIEQERTRPKDS